MPKCSACGKYGIFLKINESGYCATCEQVIYERGTKTSTDFSKFKTENLKDEAKKNEHIISSKISQDSINKKMTFKDVYYQVKGEASLANLVNSIRSIKNIYIDPNQNFDKYNMLRSMYTNDYVKSLINKNLLASEDYIETVDFAEANAISDLVKIICAILSHDNQTAINVINNTIVYRFFNETGNRVTELEAATLFNRFDSNSLLFAHLTDFVLESLFKHDYIFMYGALVQIKKKLIKKENLSQTDIIYLEENLRHIEMIINLCQKHNLIVEK